jgi:ankyrin repeat protein
MTIAAATLCAAMALPAHANNITRQQTCEKTAEHVVDVLQARDWAGDAASEIAILQGFMTAQQRLIEEGIAASVSAFNMSEDQVRAMVDQQGGAIAGQIDARYGDALYRDYTVSLANCAQLFPDDLGTTPAQFDETLQTIGLWAQQGR